MESWTLIGFFVASGVTLAIAVLALVLDTRRSANRKGGKPHA